MSEGCPNCQAPAAGALQSVPHSRHHPGIHCPLYPFFNLAAQRFDLLRRIAHHNKTPFTRIQPFAITALADCHRWLPPVTLMNATHALPLLLERPAARERKAHCQDLDMHRLRSVEMVRSDFLP